MQGGFIFSSSSWRHLHRTRSHPNGRTTMRFHLHPLGNAIRRHKSLLQDGILLLALMAVAALIAFEYDVFPNAPGVAIQEQVIELDEALSLAALLCVSLLVLSWRFLVLQRREMARRIEAEGRARGLVVQADLQGLSKARSPVGK